MDYEKGTPQDEKVVTSHANPTVASDPDTSGEWRDQEDFMTRNGLNLKSFQRRPKGGPLTVLDKSMKTRHLHMIAIGGSIGAGFFVGSGAALAKGVRFPRQPPAISPTDMLSRALLLSSSTSPSWES
jgi:amino acid transporter